MIEWLRNFLSDPLHSFIVGSLLSGILIECIVSYYYHKKGIKKRGLTYRVNEVRTLIVKGGQASSLTILHNDTEMVGDITAVHIAIWNQGRETIRPEHMLRPLIIETENSVPILEVNVRKMTQDVIELRLDESKCDQGQLGVFWDILEENDGGIVQIIYAGSPDIKITGHATVEGQKKIIDFPYLRHLEPNVKPQMYFAMFTSFVYAIFLFPGLYEDIVKFFVPPDSTTVTLWLRVPSFIIGVLALISCLSVLFKHSSILRHQKPPFEF